MALENTGMSHDKNGHDRAASHPIEGLMKTAMESIKGMVDVNTVVGDPVQTQDGGTIIPISKVSFGFAAGGGEFWNRDPSMESQPFGGGSGAGVSVHPVGFLVVQGESVRLLSVERGDMLENLVNSAPQIVEQIQDFIGRRKSGGGGEHSTIISPDSVS